ncbi:hypothetical protein BpHYR1_040879 [Brachionus plicatilis]|uniref:Uncharacterized protein n=1 Tax=Brachionus plicatilis TaxID=10195 RepID=A0A3M7T8G9_BRAPC|nr:hypothetical protein BpHYR1_040879 [Brachionus plicatilis]
MLFRNLFLRLPCEFSCKPTSNANLSFDVLVDKQFDLPYLSASDEVELHDHITRFDAQIVEFFYLINNNN